MNEDRELFLKKLSKVTCEVSVINKKLMDYLQVKHALHNKTKNKKDGESLKTFESVAVNRTINEQNVIIEVNLSENKENLVSKYNIPNESYGRKDNFIKQSKAKPNNQIEFRVEEDETLTKKTDLKKNEIEGYYQQFHSEIIDLSDLLELYVVKQKNSVHTLNFGRQELKNISIYSVYRSINEMFSRISLLNNQEIRTQANQLKRQLDSSINLIYSLN